MSRLFLRKCRLRDGCWPVRYRVALFSRVQFGTRFGRSLPNREWEQSHMLAREGRVLPFVFGPPNAKLHTRKTKATRNEPASIHHVNGICEGTSDSFSSILAVIGALVNLPKPDLGGSRAGILQLES